jgi:hypothetical protein
MGEKGMHKKFWSENLKGTDHSEDVGVDETCSIKGGNFLTS